MAKGVGSFEENLTQYVDQTSLLGDPLWFLERLDDLPYPSDEEVARMDTFRREALRASLYARIGKPNPHAGFWAVVWLWWELRLRVAGGGGVAEVPALAVSKERVRRTVPPDAARHAGVMVVTQALEMSRDASLAESDGKSSMAHLDDVFREFGFAEQGVSGSSESAVRTAAVVAWRRSCRTTWDTRSTMVNAVSLRRCSSTAMRAARSRSLAEPPDQAGQNIAISGAKPAARALTTATDSSSVKYPRVDDHVKRRVECVPSGQAAPLRQTRIGRTYDDFMRPEVRS